MTKKIDFRFILCLGFLMLVSIVYAQKQNMLLIEAESFTDKGGWVVDTQFMDQMGSPFLLAHGMGNPVKNALINTDLPKKGKWHIFARTWDWCSPWKTQEIPGRFQIIVNGKTLSNELGTGKQWGWEYAGEIDIDSKDVNIQLQDLTGFEGRCDAILFSLEKNVKIPNEGDEMYQFRKKMLGFSKPENGGNYDLIVVGGGLAGLCASLKASQSGLKVALIHDRPIPGGNNSKEIGIVVSGGVMLDPYPKLGYIINKIGNIYINAGQIDQMLQEEKNLSYFPNMHVFELEKEGNKIKSVIARNIESNKEKIFYAPLFVDCTGDANIGYLAGAHYLVGRESRQETRETLAPDMNDNIVLGATIKWNSKDSATPVFFPECQWALKVDDKSCEKVLKGSNWWEAGFNYDQVNEAEYIRDYLFRAIYGNWAFLKNKSKDKEEFTNKELTGVWYIAAKRESRRLIGDVFFKQQDIEKEYIQYDDAIVTGTYSIDQHFPTPKHNFFFPGEEFISVQKHNFNPLGVPRMYLRKDQVNGPYRIPYRCLYSKNIENLFMAGRNISVSHIALSSTRVQGTTGMMGELVGVAANLCVKYNCSPREIYTKYLNELKDLLK